VNNLWNAALTFQREIERERGEENCEESWYISNLMREREPRNFEKRICNHKLSLWPREGQRYQTRSGNLVMERYISAPLHLLVCSSLQLPHLMEISAPRRLLIISVGFLLFVSHFSC
jgi:hypothetical protein